MGHHPEGMSWLLPQSGGGVESIFLEKAPNRLNPVWTPLTGYE